MLFGEKQVFVNWVCFLAPLGKCSILLGRSRLSMVGSWGLLDRCWGLMIGSLVVLWVLDRSWGSGPDLGASLDDPGGQGRGAGGQGGGGWEVLLPPPDSIDSSPLNSKQGTINSKRQTAMMIVNGLQTMIVHSLQTRGLRL